MAAAYALAYALVSPPVSRLVEWLTAPAWSLLALSALSGATMPATYLNPAAGLIIALLLAAIGSASPASQRRTEPPARRSARRAGTALRLPGFPLLILTFIAFGVAQTIIDIGVVAFSQEHGAKALSGPILAALALASAVIGLWYGARNWQSPPERRLVTALTLFHRRHAAVRRRVEHLVPVPSRIPRIRGRRRRGG